MQQSPPLPRTEQESDKEIQERKEEKGTHKGCPQAVVLKKSKKGRKKKEHTRVVLRQWCNHIQVLS